MRAADPRYITHGDDGNSGDILLTMAQVKELITVKLHSEEIRSTSALLSSFENLSETYPEVEVQNEERLFLPRTVDPCVQDCHFWL
jgi:hypothetical protein